MPCLLTPNVAQTIDWVSISYSQSPDNASAIDDGMIGQVHQAGAGLRAADFQQIVRSISSIQQRSEIAPVQCYSIDASD